MLVQGCLEGVALQRPLRPKLAFTAPSREEFDQAVDHDANPEVDEQTEIEAIGLMTARDGQVRH